MMPSNPFPRSSAEDDALDRALNDHARGDTALPAAQDATDAIAFHDWAEGIRRTDPAASGPAAGTWNHVLRQTVQTTEGGTPMSSATYASGYGASAPSVTRLPDRSRISRYLNIAASVAMLAAMVLGGWFVLGQLPPGNGGDRFAALQATPDIAQTCDVDPLTVDEVMAIVENPYSVAPDGAWGTPSPDDEGANTIDEGLLESPSMFRMPESPRAIADEQEFAAIQSASSQYLNCRYSGTVAQVMRLMHPEMVQFYVLSNFPVYRDQAEVKAFVTNAIDLPFAQVSPAFREIAQEAWPTHQTMLATAERSRVRVADSTGFAPMDNRVALVGVDTVDADGNVIGTTDWDATILEGDAAQNNGGVSMIMVYAEATDTWYFYGFNAPRG